MCHLTTEPASMPAHRPSWPTFARHAGHAIARAEKDADRWYLFPEPPNELRARHAVAVAAARAEARAFWNAESTRSPR